MDKAYIVANDQQKNKIREKSNDKADFDSQAGDYEFPYVLVDSEADGWIYYSTMWSAEYDFGDHLEIVFDGRKEEQMSDKYVVSQEFMNELKGWKDDIRHEWFDKKDDGKWLNSANIIDLERITEDWWLDTEISYKESNNRLIAIIRWVNGEDVFEVEKPKKWVVRSKDIDSDNNRLYVEIEKHDNLKYDVPTLAKEVPENATKFDTKEEAQSWANAHQEVIEVNE